MKFRAYCSSPCRLDSRFDAAVVHYANLYGIPPELLAATQAVESVDDQHWYSVPADIIVSGYAAAANSPFGSGQGADGMLGLIDLVLYRGRGSPGIGMQNFHIDAAESVSRYFDSTYSGTSMAAGVPARRTLAQTLVDLGRADGNLRYAAAYLRMLADTRTGHKAAHLNDLTDLDMAIVYGAYRGGFRKWGGPLGFPTAVTMNEHGPIFLSYLNLYKGYFK